MAKRTAFDGRPPVDDEADEFGDDEADEFGDDEADEFEDEADEFGDDEADEFEDEADEFENRSRKVVAGKSAKELERKLAEATRERLKLQRQLDLVKAKTEATSKVQLKTVKNLSVADREYLEELKDTDPEQWRAELNALEKRFKEEYDTAVEKEVAKKKLESLRGYIIDAIKEEYPKAKFTAEDFGNLPHRLVKGLEDGSIEYADFISQAGKYLNSGKTTKRVEPTMKEPNLNRIRNSGTGSRPKPRPLELF